MKIFKEYLTRLIEKSMPDQLFNLYLNLAFFSFISALLMTVVLILLIEIFSK